MKKIIILLTVIFVSCNQHTDLNACEKLAKLFQKELGISEADIDTEACRIRVAQRRQNLGGPTVDAERECILRYDSLAQINDCFHNLYGTTL